MWLVLTLDLISAVGDHTAAATLSLAGVITTTTTDGTISTATASVFIIFTAADFTVAAATGRDELPLIRKDRSTNAGAEQISDEREPSLPAKLQPTCQKNARKARMAAKRHKRREEIGRAKISARP
jgi:hypothetical protein